MHMSFMPTPPTPTTTKKPEGGLVRKIFHKTAKKFSIWLFEYLAFVTDMFSTKYYDELH